ncbi:MAG TPA: hypothetical protein VFL94_05095 [Actinomycetales bacterium]|nr:hypothetical protein [Actinomycetales bacterium]
MDVDPAVHRLLHQQSGLATRAQLYELGVTQQALRWRLGRQWAAVLGSVVSSSRERLTAQQRLVAAQLESGPHGVVTGVHACLVHGLTGVPGNRLVQVLVPMNLRSRRVGWVDVQRTRRPDPRAARRGLVTVASLPRAVMDAARAARGLDEARSVVIEAVQRGLCSLDELGEELAAGPRRWSAFARRALVDATDGAWSVPEAHLRRACESSPRLPRVVPNPVLSSGGIRLLSPDLWFDDVALAVMVHSRQYHQRGVDWERTVERDAELTEHGVTVLAFTPRSIATDLDRVVATIERTYLQLAHGGRPRPEVEMTPREPVDHAKRRV